MNLPGKDLGELDPQGLLDAARQQAGLDDFGDMGFVEPLTRLMHALVSEANLNPMGLLGTKARVIQCLVNRLRVQQAVKEHPEILEEDVSDPIMIIGLPRTGTTKLQRMMSSDPAVQKTRYWQLLNPAPLPGWKRGEPDARIALARAQTDALTQQPEFLAAHPMGAEEIDEDVFMMDIAFEGILPLVQYHVPTFEKWVLGRSRKYFYDYEKILLQYLQWQDGGRRNRPWVLKATTHFGGIETLIDTFPGITFVHCHRDVGTSVASMIRAAEGFRGLMANDLDLVQLGEDYLRIDSEEILRYLQQRERLGSKLRIIDARYDDIVADPMQVIRSVYHAHGLPLSSEGERAMHDWEAKNPQYRFGKVSYSLDRYGLTKAQVEAAFSAYRKKFAAMF